MRRDLITLVLIAGLIPSLHAQNLLRSEWKFKTGDNSAWAWPAFDDSAWEIIEAGTDWEKQGYSTYDGFAWYRQEVFIPEHLKKQAIDNGGLMLRLARIDDSDVTYFNGQILGATGGLPPDYQSGYGDPRVYTVPADRVSWGAQNTIAIRVYDGGGGGGIVGNPVSLAVIGMEELLEMVPLMDRQDHLFLEEGPVGIQILVENKMKQRVSGVLHMTASSDFGEVVADLIKELKVGAQGVKEVALELGQLSPGFYKITLTFESESGNKRVEFAIGVRPEEIVSPLDRPGDFENYWMRARRELDAVDPQFRLIRQDKLCTETREIFLVEMRSLGNILIRGWYKRPVKEGVYPAILHVQGYSSEKTPQTLYQGDDMVSLALNIRGHGNSRDHVNPGFPVYLQHRADDRELYIYRGAYMDCVRAVDFLYSRSEVDTSRVAVEGGSQGGALSFATAALDNRRIDLCVPQVPFLSDFRDYFKLVAWPGGEFEQYFEEHPEISEDEIYKNLSYIDIKNLAPWIKAPVLMSVGLMDQTCPPHINFAAYNQLQVPREYVVYPDAGHSLPAENYPVMVNYIRKQFGMD
ncbi:MAG: acetylxylan esterase [Bacteroidales bacterium]|nr:acetylxylan esterase [Bacteroidales bacterium]